MPDIRSAMEALTLTNHFTINPPGNERTYFSLLGYLVADERLKSDQYLIFSIMSLLSHVMRIKEVTTKDKTC